eukprot:SAG31_NODE_257_length_18942_cov_6.099135_9_plen_71_part_00
MAVCSSDLPGTKGVWHSGHGTAVVGPQKPGVQTRRRLQVTFDDNATLVGFANANFTNATFNGSSWRRGAS